MHAPGTKVDIQLLRSRLQNPWLGQGKLLCAFHNLLGQAFKTRGHRDVMQRGMWFHCDISWSILYIVMGDLWIVSSILWIVSDGACGLTDKEAKAVPNLCSYIILTWMQIWVACIYIYISYIIFLFAQILVTSTGVTPIGELYGES